MRTRDKYYLMIASIGFTVGRNLGFAPTHQGLLMGYHIRRRKQLTYVKRRVNSFVSMDAQDRGDALLDISRGLASVYGADQDDRKMWLNKPNAHLNQKTPRQMMLTGHLLDLRSVAEAAKKLAA